MKTKLVSIIIVNWNGMRWLRDCFASIHAQNYMQFEIIFVDNASTDGSVAWVKKHYPKTIIVINKINLGFAGANNVGYRAAKGDYVLFLNNDTRVTKNFLIELLRVVERDSQIAGAQSKILLMDYPDTHDSVGAFLTPTGFLYHYGFGKKDSPKYDKEIGLYTAKGACMLFRKSVLDTVAIDGNIFDPDYFAYFEETDMCHKIWLSGKKIVYAYKSVIYHKMGATSSSMNNAFIQYHSFKNRIRTYIKNFEILTLIMILPAHLILCEGFSFVSLVRGKYQLFWAIQQAFFWNIRYMGETWRQRSIVQKIMRKTSDNDIFKTLLYRPGLTYYVGLASGHIHE